MHKTEYIVIEHYIDDFIPFCGHELLMSVRNNLSADAIPGSGSLVLPIPN
jgi:hypothetical protein